jgi:hypothetical protein
MLLCLLLPEVLYIFSAGSRLLVCLCSVALLLVAGVKRDRGVTLTTHSHPFTRSVMRRSYTWPAMTQAVSRRPQTSKALG